ncbi:MAG: hypothetical protein JKX78_07965 [Alteromonadaceae bacterium]|nr:hypothetical protein [Alteromonadaceae bacterium]
MNWLAKINLKSIFLRLGTFKSAFFVLIFCALFLYIGYRFGNFYHSYQQTSIAQQDMRLHELYQEQEKNIDQINTLEIELEIERMANQKSIAMLHKIEAAHFKVKKELGFYEKVMAPEKQAEGVVIDNLTIYATKSQNHYRFQLVLVQQNKKKRYAKGYIKLSALGSLNNKPTKLDLIKIAKISKKRVSFNFQYFQMIEGGFSLPKGFNPEQLTVAAILSKNKWQKYHRLDKKYPWRVN